MNVEKLADRIAEAINGYFDKDRVLFHESILALKHVELALLRSLTEEYAIRASNYTKVAAPMAGADGVNPSQLSDNGPAHQIAVLPLAEPPSDNSSLRETASPCDDCSLLGQCEYIPLSELCIRNHSISG